MIVSPLCETAIKDVLRRFDCGDTQKLGRVSATLMRQMMVAGRTRKQAQSMLRTAIKDILNEQDGTICYGSGVDIEVER